MLASFIFIGQSEIWLFLEGQHPGVAASLFYIYNCDLAKIKQSSATQTTTQSYTWSKQAYS
jgi:hypothetical protein